MDRDAEIRLAIAVVVVVAVLAIAYLYYEHHKGPPPPPAQAACEPCAGVDGAFYCTGLTAADARTDDAKWAVSAQRKPGCPGFGGNCGITVTNFPEPPQTQAQPSFVVGKSDLWFRQGGKDSRC